jgi:transcriptional regulator with XRE-family HTH domain
MVLSKLKKLRLLSGMTGVEVAKELGISGAYWSYIENGHRNPSKRIREKIKFLFHCTDSIFEKRM